MGIIILLGLGAAIAVLIAAIVGDIRKRPNPVRGVVGILGSITGGLALAPRLGHPFSIAGDVDAEFLACAAVGALVFSVVTLPITRKVARASP